MRRQAFVGAGAVAVLAIGVGANASAQEMVDGVAVAGKPAVTEKRAPSITSEQRAMLNEKLALIRQIYSAAEADMQMNAVSSETRRALLESLFAMPLAQVQQMGVPGSFEGTSRAMIAVKAASKSNVQQKLGQANTELVFLPITPCRYIDTRFGGGGIVSGTRGIDLENTGASYGGSGACDPVTQAGLAVSSAGAAIAMNVAILGPTGAPGFMGARPIGSANTTSFVNWYEAGPSVQASNWGVVSIDQTGALDEFEFFGGPAHVIVDVFGMFANPTATALDCTNVQAAGSGTIANGGEVTIGARPACPAGYTIVSVACMNVGALSPGVMLQQVGPQDPSPGGWSACRWFNASGGSVNGSDFRVASNCCRLPGR